MFGKREKVLFTFGFFLGVAYGAGGVADRISLCQDRGRLP